jgi:hypothetical protein
LHPHQDGVRADAHPDPPGLRAEVRVVCHHGGSGAGRPERLGLRATEPRLQLPAAGATDTQWWQAPPPTLGPANPACLGTPSFSCQP